MAHGPSCSAACEIFPDQGSNPRPLHWQADSQPLRHQGSPRSTHINGQRTLSCQAGLELRIIALSTGSLRRRDKRPQEEGEEAFPDSGDETKGMGGSYLEKVHLTTILCAFQTLDLKVNWYSNTHEKKWLRI